MSVKRVPPAAPQPIVTSVTHMSVDIEWAEYLERLQAVFDATSDGTIFVELSQKKAPSKWKASDAASSSSAEQTSEENDSENSGAHWSTVYKGTATNYSVSKLDADTKYLFRIRFQNNHGWGAHSNVVSAETLKPPLTGENIHKAIRQNDVEELRKVLNKKQVSIEATDNYGFTPLMSATQKGYLELAELLIQYGCDLDNCTESGKTALMLCAFKGQTQCLMLLLEKGAAVNAVDRNGMTSLHYAVDGEQLNCLRCLVDAGANVMATDSVMGWTPLMRCIGLKNNGNLYVTRELVRNNGGLNEQDKEGKTPLHIAILNGHEEAILFFLQNGANVSARTKNGHSAMSLAEASENRNIKATIQDFIMRQTV